MEAFWEGLGEGLGRVLGVKNGKTGIQEGSEKKAEKEDEKRRKISNLGRELAAERRALGREDLGPELALISPARHSTLPLEGGGGSLSAKRSAASSLQDSGGWRLQGSV